MKNRIKKFYNDHEEAILVYLCTLAGCAVAGVIVTKQLEKENSVCCLKEWMHKETGETVVEVFQKNGKITIFDTSDQPNS